MYYSNRKIFQKYNSVESKSSSYPILYQEKDMEVLDDWDSRGTFSNGMENLEIYNRYLIETERSIS